MERRQAPRIPMDTPCLLTLILNYEVEHRAMAVDVSQGGVQLALSPGSGQEEIAPGMPVTLKDVSAPLSGVLEGAHGKIAWVGVRCCGVRLNRELPVNPADEADFARL